MVYLFYLLKMESIKRKARVIPFGYKLADDTDYIEPVESELDALKEEILERAEYSLALNSAKAVKGLVDSLDEDGKTPGVNIRMEAAKQILDRVGLVKKDKIEMTGQVAHGIFILPAKDGAN